MNQQAVLNDEKAAVNVVASNDCSLDALQVTLSELLSLNERLLALTLAERSAIVANDIQTLDRLILEKLRLTRQITRLEDRRQALVKLIPGNPTSISELLSSLDSATAAQFQAIHERLIKVILLLDLENRRNAMLLTSVVQAIRRTVDLVLGVHNEMSLGYAVAHQRVDGNRLFGARVLDQRV